MTLRMITTMATALFVLACRPAVEQPRMVGELASDRIELAAEFPEPIVSRQVVEGQAVSQGDIILLQDTSRAKARVREAEATLAQNQARLDELTRGPRREQIVAAQANVAGAEQDLAFRQTELQRILDLLNRKLSSPAEKDKAKAALDGARARLDFDRARLDEMLTGTTVEELDQARAAVQRTQAQLEGLQIDVDRLTTTAPTDGLLDSFLFEPGERPAGGQPMAIMLSGHQPYARVYVPETLRASVSPGTPAIVFADGVSEPIHGRFRWIASEAAFTPYFALTEHDRGRLTYLAKIDIDVTGRRLPDGVPVEVEIAARGPAGK